MTADRWQAEAEAEPFPWSALAELAAYAVAIVLLSALAFRLSPLGNVPQVATCATAGQDNCRQEIPQTLDTGH